MPEPAVKPLPVMDCIRPAVNTTEKMLFSPFQWSNWWRLALLGLATGEAASSGGCNFNTGDWSKIADAAKGQPQHTDFLAGQAVPGIPDSTIAAIVAVLVVGVVLLAFVHLYVSSVARFMLFDAVATRRNRLREGWKRWHSHGLRYFFFQLLFGLVGLGVMIVVIGVPALIAWRAGVFSDLKAHWGTLVAELVVFLPVFFVVWLAFAVFAVFVKDFVVPVMALESLTIREAISKVWTMARSKKGDYTVYVLMKVLLAIVTGIAMAIITIILMLIILVPVVILVVAMVAANPHIFESPATIAILVTLAVIALVPLMFIFGLIATPIVVFFQSFVLNFFGSRYMHLWVFMHPEGVPSPPPPAPPLPGGQPPPPYDIIPPEPAG